jgi:hypothetical protein
VTPERWNEILERSRDVGPVRPPNEGLARGAVRVHLVMSANAGDGPVGIVTDRRYLLPDPPAPSGQSPQSKALVRMHQQRKARAAQESPAPAPEQPAVQPSPPSAPAAAPPPAPSPAPGDPYMPRAKRDLYAELAAAVRNTAKAQKGEPDDGQR